MGVSLKAEVGGDEIGVPTSDRSIDPSLPFPQLQDAVRVISKELFEKWAHVEDDQLVVMQVSGGITNLLLKVSFEGAKEEDSVTVRVFGPDTDAVIDRKRELKAIRYLSSAGFGAKLLGVFQNGMVQSFIDARTLTPSDMSSPMMAAHIAREVRKLHDLDIPGSKDPQLWIDLSKLLEKASMLSFDDHVKQQKYESISFKQLREEIQSLQEISSLLRGPVVFAHNDLLSGNLMYNDIEDKLYLIDFEYGSYNYRGYDLGNHFAEYAGFECDYSLYPKKEAQYHFFRHYLSTENDDKVSDADLEKVYIETNFYALVSHVFWAVWAIVQAKFSSIDFDYLAYFFQRFREYENKKNETLSLVTRYLADSKEE